MEVKAENTKYEVFSKLVDSENNLRQMTKDFKKEWMKSFEQKEAVIMLRVENAVVEGIMERTHSLRDFFQEHIKERLKLTAENIHVPDLIRGPPDPEQPEAEQKKFVFKSFKDFVKAV